jgi:AraC-like DNA-binding protein
MNEIDIETSCVARSIGRWTTGKLDWITSIPNLMLFRRDQPSPPAICLIEPSVVLVVQGAKRLFIGGQGHLADESRFVVTSLNVPGQSEVVEASSAMPCLGLAMRLDLKVMAELIAQGAKLPPAARTRDRSMVVGGVTATLIDPLKRLLDLLDEPDAIPIMAPLIEREIHYRLLVSNQSAQLWEAALAGSQSHRIVAAIDWLRSNYAQPLRVNDLAARAQMSVTTFHHHFRQLTVMSPLQYQKWLRLNEARRLMLNEDFDAATAAFQVGYESPSQFSREYSRLFGAPPKRDVEQMRHSAKHAISPMSAPP